MKNKFKNYLSSLIPHLSSPIGFTLIELLWSVVIAAMLSSVGIAAFFIYSRQQALNSAVSEFTTMLQVAKSRAQSQVNICPPILGVVFNGYSVVIVRDTPGYYLLKAVCRGSITENLNRKDLPSGIKFCGTSLQTFSFSVITGTATDSLDLGQVIISGYGKTKIVSVSPSGVIKVTDGANVCP